MLTETSVVYPNPVPGLLEHHDLDSKTEDKLLEKLTIWKKSNILNERKCRYHIPVRYRTVLCTFLKDLKAPREAISEDF